VSREKRVLIITDGTEAVVKTAQSIAGLLDGCSVNICASESFEGTDLLPADVFFIGCGSPNPASFGYLSKMLEHINLAGRRCGVFSNDSDALKYLCGITASCEAKMGKPLLVGENPVDSINQLINEIVLTPDRWKNENNKS